MADVYSYNTYRIIIGSSVASPLFEFQHTEAQSDLKSMSGSVGLDVVGNELSIDEIRFIVDLDVGGVEFIAPSDYDRIMTSDNYLLASNKPEAGDILTLPYGTPIRIYCDDNLMYKFYAQSVMRRGKYDYEVVAVSAIGLLDKIQHNGGLYNGVLFSTVVGDIIGTVVPYSIAEDVGDVTIYGWLPIGTARSNLHQLLFACGISLKKDANGDIQFVFIYGGEGQMIPVSRVFQEGSVNYVSPSTAVEVTEHAYAITAADAEETLFDNVQTQEAATHTFVTFDNAPIHDLRADGTLTIEESNVNYAIVSGIGTLYGKPYNHTTHVVRKETANAANAEPNVRTVTEATLVNAYNSQNVASRVMSYYGSQKQLNAAIVLKNEKPGQLYKVPSVYDDIEDIERGNVAQGYLARMDLSFTSLIRAECQFITDYIPTGQGNNYTEHIVLTGEGTWQIPEKVLAKTAPTARVVLIGGGHGGEPGETGQPGWRSWSAGRYYEGGGEGGAGGAGGSAGKVLVTTVSLAGLTYVEYSCGEGGESGQDGGATTFGSETSASGVVYANGYTDMSTGTIYALSGTAGVAGGHGVTPHGSTVTYNGQTWQQGNPGTKSYNESIFEAWSGVGGGPAVGANGGNGGNPNLWQEDGEFLLAPGSGGNGATATIPGEDAAVYGSGGNGGHGGGGGGHNGTAATSEPTVIRVVGASQGQGGAGSAGGKGGNGCIIILC